MGPTEQFEIRVRQDGRWNIQSVCKREKEALTRAETLLESGQFEAVEVVLERMMPSGGSSEKVILSKESTKKVEKKVNVSPVETAPYCKTVDQMYTVEARRTIGRLLREFCDMMLLTPTELIYTHRALTKLNDMDSLLPSAVDRIAKVQARKTGENGKDRNKNLYKIVEAVIDRARRSEIIDMKDMPFSRLVLAVESTVPKEGQQHAVMTALTKKLSGAMIWDGKIEILLDLIDDGDLSPWSASLLDSVIAELLDMPKVLRELMGNQPDLVHALEILIGLSRGNYTPKKWDTPNIHKLAAIMAAKPMPACKQILGECVARQLSSKNPLTRGNKKDEEKALEVILESLLDGHDFVGGRGTLDAVTRRFSRDPDGGMDPKSPEDTLAAILDIIKKSVSPIYQLRGQIKCLLDLSRTDFGKRNIKEIVRHLGLAMNNVNELYDLTYYRLPVRKRMADVSDLQKIALECDLPGKVNEALAAKLDEIFCVFLEQEQIIQKLDNPNDTLSARAVRLLQFCASGILTQGNAQKLAGEAVLAYLRQPNFVETYTEGAKNDAEKDEMIRQLHKLIAASGVQM